MNWNHSWSKFIIFRKKKHLSTKYLFLRRVLLIPFAKIVALTRHVTRVFFGNRREITKLSSILRKFENTFSLILPSFLNTFGTSLNRSQSDSRSKREWFQWPHGQIITNSFSRNHAVLISNNPFSIPEFFHALFLRIRSNHNPINFHRSDNLAKRISFKKPKYQLKREKKWANFPKL